MHKLIAVLVVMTCASAVLGQSWGYYITYSNDNCTTPVAIELTQVQGCRFKRSTEQALDCTVLDNYPSYYYTAGCVDGAKPNTTEFSALPVVVTTYPSSDNCTVKDYVKIYYFAENYSGPIVVNGIGGSRTEGTVNTTCSDAGVLTAVVCNGLGCPVDYTLPENQCVVQDDSAVQTGCSALPSPTSVPSSSDTPSESGAPQAPHTNSPAAAPSVRTPNSSASAVSAVISAIALINLVL